MTRSQERVLHYACSIVESQFDEIEFTSIEEKDGKIFAIFAYNHLFCKYMNISIQIGEFMFKYTGFNKNPEPLVNFIKNALIRKVLKIGGVMIYEKQ